MSLKSASLIALRVSIFVRRKNAAFISEDKRINLLVFMWCALSHSNLSPLYKVFANRKGYRHTYENSVWYKRWLLRTICHTAWNGKKWIQWTKQESKVNWAKRFGEKDWRDEDGTKNTTGSTQRRKKNEFKRVRQKQKMRKLMGERLGHQKLQSQLLKQEISNLGTGKKVLRLRW